MPSTALLRGRKRLRVRTPTALQMEATECGAVALGMVLAWHGRHVPPAELREQCGVSRDGSNAANLVKAAERYGLQASGWSKELDDLRELEPPFIVFWRFNHFVVVEEVGPRHVWLNDPAAGHRKVDAREFDESFTGVVLTFEPTEAFERGGTRPSLLEGLRSRLRGMGGALAHAVVAGFLLVLPGLAVPALMQVFIDDVLIQGRSDWARPLLLGLIAAVAAGGLLRYLQLVGLLRMRIALAGRESARFLGHLLRLPVAFYGQRYAGEIAKRNALNDKVASALSGGLAQTVIDAAMMVFYAGLMMFYDVRLTLIGVLFACLDFAALRMIARRRIEANLRLNQEYGRVTGIAVAGLQGMESIKASGLESGFFRRWASSFSRASNARQELEISSLPLGVLPGLFHALALALVLAFGGLAVVDGRLTIGMLVAFGLLMSAFLRPVGGLVALGSTLQELLGDLARLDDVLGHGVEESRANAEPAAGATCERKLRLDGKVELRGVRFGYSRTEPALIEDFDLVLEPGKRVALVGGSGSGKTTLARLVSGLWRPWSGEILFDGVPRDELPSEVLCNSIALVDQELSLFAGSVRDNLTLWDASVPDGTLLRAVGDAGIAERIRGLPGGLGGTLLEGGSNLSGGERQRLEIARALAGDPSVLVLDEATSALDAQTERHVVERIALRACTCLIVAHRLSTVRDCDEIIVLENGRVVERGTHRELWSRKGAYARLLRSDEGELSEVTP
jgi:ATP-binding cassette, subfamily C, bacterial